ncbi:MAG: TlpA family protein disulfide reductase [Flavobacteriales bacterium]|nr:TlpA family protein disulfide reductase [Flavobacteriales bacterium]
MKHTILLPLFSAVLLTACSTGGGQREISVKVDGAAGPTLYFDRFAANKPVHVDSVVLDAKGSGSLKVPVMPLDFYRLALNEKDNIVVVLDSTESLTLETTSGNIGNPSKIEGSAQTKALYAYYNSSRTFEQQRDSLRALVNANPQDQAALQRFNDLNKGFYDRSKNFVQENMGSPIALAALSRMDMGQDAELFKSTRDALRKTMPRSEFFAGFRDQVDRMEKQLEAQKAQEAEMERLSNLIPVGSEAPDFSQQDPNGKTIALSSLRGKVVLIDFWASWCKPCRMENPNVKRVYEKYHAKGFEILGVSLDRDKNSWMGAIQQDGLPWLHVSDLQFWNNAAAQQYGISSIPFTVLVDKDGKVIDKNLRGPALEAKLAELFGA